jgi:hypothetical protein
MNENNYTDPAFAAMLTRAGHTVLRPIDVGLSGLSMRNQVIVLNHWR